MEIRGPDQDEFRSNYGFVERRRDQGSSNGVGHMQNGSKTPPAGTPNAGATLPNYPQPAENNHRAPGSVAKRPYEKYRECLRNHAASLGGNVYDGCGEFMPAGEEGTLEGLKCAACECHRNFHRKETDGEQASTPQLRRRSANATPNFSNNAPPMLHGPHLPALSYHPHPHPYHHQRYAPVVQPMPVGYESSSEEMNMYHSNNSMDHQGGVAPPPPPYVLSKKRFRTKFTAEQKERMMEFADKIGWRINRQEEGEVERFCEAAGIRRQVFKVWMHNNKNVRKTDAPPDLDDKSNHEI